MKKLALLIGVMVIFSIGCIVPKKTITLITPFDRQQAERLMAPGKNTINVNAFLRQKGGGVVTCAASKVVLIPATDSAKEFIMKSFGSERGGFIDYASNTGMSIDGEEPEFYQVVKKDICNSDGKVSFEKVADGEFYILTYVLWDPPVKYVLYKEGGVLCSLVSVRGGEVKNVVLTH